MKKLLALCLVAFSTATQAGTWSTAAWSGDATSGIASTQTQWAYHFGSATAATVNGVSVTGIATASVSNTNVDATFVTAVPSTNNNLAALGGTGSGVLAGSFIHQGNPGSVTVKGLTVGFTYTVSFLGVGFNNPGAATSTFTSSSDSRIVDESEFGLSNGIRVDYTFTANATTRVFSVSNSSQLSSWRLHALALLRVTTTPTVTTPTSASITGTSAVLGGNVTSDGLTAVTERGVVYAPTSSNSDPLISGSNVIKAIGSGQTGVFTVSIASLTPGVGYSFKAYATNILGTSYSSIGSFTTLSNNAVLSGLTLSEGSLAPVFAGSSTGYTATVSAATATLLVTPTVAQAGATVTVNELPLTVSGASSPIALDIGGNAISIVVTAEDGLSKRAYSIVVTRLALPTVTTLTSASITGTSATLGGTVTDDGLATITERGVVYALTATNNNPLIGGSGVTKLPAASATLGSFTVGASSLIPGSSYTFKAYATNSEGNGYTSAGTFVTLSNNAALSALALSVGTLTPTFNASTLSYTVSVSNTTTSLTVKPTLAQAGATQTVNGQALASATFSAPINLNVGSNPISIAVLAQDGITTRTYSVAVTRLSAPEINVTGNGASIASGDFIASSADHTDFGVLRAAPGSSLTRTFTIQNLGTADLLLNRTPKVAVTGPDASDFVVTAQPTSPVTVAAGSTTFNVTFNPSAGGARLAILIIGSNDADEASYSFAIKGTGKWIGDDFADAQPLTGSSASATATNVDATSEVGEPYHGKGSTGTAASSMWWVWTAPSNGSATVSLLASDYGTVLSIYTGSSLGNLTKVVASDDFNGTGQSKAIFSTVAGTTYHIAVDGFNGQTGNIDLQLELLLLPNVSVAVAPDSIVEGGPGAMVYTFTRDGDAASAFTATFSVGGTATFATDYSQSGAATFNATTGTIAFAANQLTATVLIVPIADSSIEADETIVLTLTAGSGYVVGSTPSAVGTIVDDDSSTVLSSNTNPSIFGQSITLTATVSAVGGTRTGLVTFKDGATILGTATPIAGVATLSVNSLTVASHSLTAAYAGDATANASVSSAITQVVNKAATSTLLESSRNPSTLGASVTFTATVATNAPGSGRASGSVVFKDGSTQIGVGTVDANGVASFSTTALSTGTHSIAADYSGSSSQLASTSAATSQLVNAALTLAPSTLPVGIVGVPYNQVLTASNGSGLRSLSTISFNAGGTGLSAPISGLNTLTLAGTATAAGTVTFTALVTDEGGGTLSVPYSVEIQNVPPTLNVTNATTNEDIQTTGGLVITRNVVDVTHVKITAITNGTLFQNDGSTAIASNSFITYAQANAGLKFSPAANFFGTGSFGLQASTSSNNTGLSGSTITSSITVTAMADTPSITSATTNEDTQTSSGLVIARNAADGTEVTHFKISGITNGTLFQANGITTIAVNDFITFAQASAGLKFSPTANFNGNGSVTIQASTSAFDAGLGGNPVTANITVNAVNDAPTFIKGADQIRPFASTAAQTVTGWATALSQGPADEASQQLTFNITNNSNPALFTIVPIIASDGTLSYTPTGNVGSATLTVTLSDDGGTSLGGANTSAVQSFTITVEQLPDYTIDVTGSSIVVTDIGGHADSLGIREPGAGSIKFSATGRSFRINQGPLLNGDGGSISLAGISAITINAGLGNDIVNVEGFTAAMPALTINGDGGDDTVNLQGNLSFVANASLDLDLSNDPGTAGIDTVRVAASASILMSGTGRSTMNVSGDIAFATGSTLQTVNGGITMRAARATGSAAGIDINGAQVRSTGTGVIDLIGSGILGSGSMVGVTVRNAGSISGGTTGTTSISGTGGTGAGGNVGVLVTGPGSFITTAGSHLAITGTTTATGATNDNNGISIKAGASVSASGAGKITLIGSGAQATGVRNYGVLLDTASKITSENGDISVSGTARSTAGDFPIGIIALNNAEIASTGTGGIALTGVGAGTTSSNSADGILLLTTNGTVGPRITTHGGLIRVDGRAGASASGYGFEAGEGATLVGGPIQVVANQFVIDTGANPSTLNAGGESVSIAPMNSGVAVALGGSDSTTQLGLTDAELDRISCGSLIISTSATPGDTLTVSAPISRSIAASANELATTNLELHSSGDLVLDQPINLGGGSLRLFSGTPTGLFKPRVTSADITAGTTIAAGNLGLAINGTVANTLYDQLNVVGSLDVSGCRLALNGSLIPATGTSFTLINNDGNDPIIGTFVGLPQGTIFSFNGIDMRISYTGGSGNDVTIEPSNTAPTISDVANSSTLEDNATGAIAISIGDGESAATALILSATSSNPSLVPNLPGSFTFSGTGASRSLVVTPVANQFGTAIITLTVSDGNLTASDTFVLTVDPVADTPVITNAATDEDSQSTNGLVVTRSIVDGSEVTHFKITAITNGTLFQSNGSTAIANGDFITFAQANVGLKFTPSTNSISSGSITIQASTSNLNAGLGGSMVTATITVNAIADTPSITNATTNEDAQTTTGLVVNRSAVDGTEVTHFKITTITHGTLFQTNGITAITANEFITFAQASAGLKFTPNADFHGTGTVSLQAAISNTNAGLGGSTATASIAVNPVADTPAINGASTNEDTQTTSGLVVTRSVTDSAEVTHFKITAVAHGTLFQNDGATAIAVNDFITFAQASAGLRFSPTPDYIGSGSVSVQASLSSSNAGLGGGVATASITINPMADTPSISGTATNEDTQSQTGLVVSRNAADEAEVTHFKITAISHGSLFQNDGITAVAVNDFITFAQASAGMRFTPAADFNGDASIAVQASTSASAAGLGGTSVTATIQVSSVNDEPSFTKGANQNRPFANTSPLTVSGWASAISTGPADESTQGVTFHITGNTNPDLFTTAPSISGTGALSYTPAGIIGSATISVTLSDDGGIARGGVDTSAVQTFTVEVLDSPDFAVTQSGSTLTITDTAGDGDALTLTEPVAGSLLFSAVGRAFSINHGFSTVGNSGSINLSGITSIVVNTAAGSDLITLGAFTSPLPSLTLNGGTGDDMLVLDGAVTFAADATLEADLQNDAAEPGQDSARVSATANLVFSGTGGLIIRGSRTVVVQTGASVDTVNGDIVLEANQQALPINFDADGLSIETAALRSSGAGSITLAGCQFGMATSPRHGVLVGAGASIASVAGSVTVTGFSSDVVGSRAVVIASNASITSPDIEINGDSIAVDTNSAKLDASSTGTVVLRQTTAGTPVGIGAADTSTTLGITEAELDRMTANTIKVGDSDSGLITVSVVLSPAHHKTFAFGQDVLFTADSGFESDVGPIDADYEKMTVAGTATITAGATLNLTSFGGYTSARSVSFTFLENDSTDPIVGEFTGPTLTDFLGSALIAARSYVGGTGNDLTITNALPVPEPLVISVLGPIVVNLSTGLLEQNIRVTNNAGYAIDGVRLTLTNQIAPYYLHNRTHPTLPIIEVRTPLLPGATQDILVSIGGSKRLVPGWVPTYSATPLVAMLITPAVHTMPSAGASYEITIVTAGSWSVHETLSWISVSTQNGSSNGPLIITLQPNSSLQPRTGVILIAGIAHTITQAGVLQPFIGAMPGPYFTIISEPFRLVVPIVNAPVTYTTTGMPPGLTLNNITGVISGFPTLAGTFAVRVTARNAVGASNTEGFAIYVAPMPRALMGSYQGLIQRSDEVYVGPHPNLGARFQLTTTAVGVITGKIIEGATTKAFNGHLAIGYGDPLNPRASAIIPATLTSPAYQIDLQLSAAGNDCQGTITKAGYPGSAAIEGWRNAWSSVAPVKMATAYKARHNFALENISSTGPDGFGFGTFVVAEATGALTITGKLPDGSNLNCTTFVGQKGEVLLYQPLYGNRGSYLGRLLISKGSIAPLNNTLVAATPTTWLKPAPLLATTTDTVYRAGFGPLNVDVAGGTYTPPTVGQRVMGLPAVTAPANNANLHFTLGGLDTAAPASLEFDQALRIANPSAHGLTNTAIVPAFNAAALPIPNPNKVAVSSLTAGTGALAGHFMLQGVAAAQNRPAPFLGQIVTTPSGTFGYGYFLLPQTPVAPQTVGTAPKLSGRIELKPLR